MVLQGNRGGKMGSEIRKKFDQRSLKIKKTAAILAELQEPERRMWKETWN